MDSLSLSEGGGGRGTVVDFLTKPIATCGILYFRM